MHEQPSGGTGAQHPPEPPASGSSLPGFPPLSAYPPPLPADPALYPADPTIPSSNWYPPPPAVPPSYPYPLPPGYPGQPGGYPYPLAMMPTAAPAFPYPYAPPDPNGGMAIAALILGIVSIVFAWTIVCNIPFAIVGIVMGELGRQSAPKRAMATWGIALSIAGILLSLAWIALQVAFVYAISPPS